MQLYTSITRQMAIARQHDAEAAAARAHLARAARRAPERPGHRRLAHAQPCQPKAVAA